MALGPLPSQHQWYSVVTETPANSASSSTVHSFSIPMALTYPHPGEGQLPKDRPAPVRRSKCRTSVCGRQRTSLIIAISPFVSSIEQLGLLVVATPKERMACGRSLRPELALRSGNTGYLLSDVRGPFVSAAARCSRLLP